MEHFCIMRAVRLLSCALLPLLLLVVRADAANNTTTASPATTPVPDAGELTILLSFRIDGVAFVARCNVSSGSFNMSACVFDTDHGLTVSRIGTTATTQEIPVYYAVMVGFTLFLSVVAVGLGVAGYMAMMKMREGYEQVMQNNNNNQPQQYQQQNNQQYPPDQYGPQPPYPGPGYAQARMGSARSSSRRVINVDLVKPCLRGGGGDEDLLP